MKASIVPDGVPILSRGRHRSPRRGACFMEFASFLAGERWSDHPRCTHPLLTQLARQVNDLVGDEEEDCILRQRRGGLADVAAQRAERLLLGRAAAPVAGAGQATVG